MEGTLDQHLVVYPHYQAHSHQEYREEEQQDCWPLPLQAWWPRDHHSNSKNNFGGLVPPVSTLKTRIPASQQRSGEPGKLFASWMAVRLEEACWKCENHCCFLILKQTWKLWKLLMTRLFENLVEIWPMTVVIAWWTETAIKSKLTVTS